MNARVTTATITQLASKALAGSGIVVDGTSLQNAGRRRLVRVVVVRDISGLADDDTSSPVEPLTLDEVADATRLVSDALDASDLMGQTPYTLEVSSAGLDRPLRTRDQLRRNVGRLVKLTHADGSTSTDRLTAVGPASLTLGEATPPVPLDDVTRAVVQVEFSRNDTKDD